MKEKFTELFKKNAEKMERAKAMYEIAAKQSNKAEPPAAKPGEKVRKLCIT